MGDWADNHMKEENRRGEFIEAEEDRKNKERTRQKSSSYTSYRKPSRGRRTGTKKKKTSFWQKLAFGVLFFILLKACMDAA